MLNMILTKPNGEGLRRLANEELVDLLFREEDRLPRQVIDEVIGRGGEIVPLLADIVMDRLAWTDALPEWWAPVHATYALGAIGSPETMTPAPLAGDACIAGNSRD